MIRPLWRIAVLSLLFSRAVGAAEEPPGAENYRVGPGDTLDIVVGGETDLTGDYQISAEGSIVYPLLGVVEVDGLDAQAIAKVIRNRLAADYLVSPQVAVYVKEYGSKKVGILGDVPNPGFFSLTGDSSLLSLLSDAGLKLTGEGTTVIVTHTAVSGGAPVAPVVLKLEELLNPWQDKPAVKLHDGDRVFVRIGGGGKIIVSGRVKRPGVVPLTEGMTVMETINKAGGLADFGSLKGVRIVRDSAEGSDVITVNLDKVMEGDRSADVPVQAGDIVVVPRRWF